MRYQEFDVKGVGSSAHVRLVTYLLDLDASFETQVRPLVVVCPGGGYQHLSNREAEIIAMQFNAMGYHAAVLYYSLAPTAVFPAALQELARSVALLRDHAKEWNVDPEHIAVMGFSAGAHVAGSLGVFWNRTEFLPKELAADPAKAKPDAMILCYPVITSGPHAHRASFDNLLGDQKDDPKLLELVSLDKQVTSDAPQAFIWHTTDDQAVPVQNSLLMTNALVEAGVPVEYHLYRSGTHGLGLADWRTKSGTGNEVSVYAQSWIPLLNTWLEQWRTM